MPSWVPFVGISPLTHLGPFALAIFEGKQWDPAVFCRLFFRYGITLPNENDDAEGGDARERDEGKAVTSLLMLDCDNDVLDRDDKQEFKNWEMKLRRRAELQQDGYHRQIQSSYSRDAGGASRGFFGRERHKYDCDFEDYSLGPVCENCQQVQFEIKRTPFSIKNARGGEDE